MRYLNLTIENLTSEAFLGSEPVQRATWLCLMRYCAQQETGGRIVGADGWGDRKWMQLCGITKAEANAECDLWEWGGTDLYVAMYPVEQEAVAKVRREAGKAYGRGHPKPKDSSPNRSPMPCALDKGKGKGKDKDKGKDKGKEECPELPLTLAHPDSTPEPAIMIPLIPSQGEYPVSHEQIDEWSKVYPGVLILQTLGEVREWCLSNRTKLKTKAGVRRFITNWLAREQNR
jgi:hypothetical protein